MKINKFWKKKLKKKEKVHKPVKAEVKTHKGEPFAAIAAALFLYYTEQHDFENYVLTIKRIEKIYSPWSSKIYGLRNSPR
jgi:hypothetical protein